MTLWVIWKTANAVFRGITKVILMSFAHTPSLFKGGKIPPLPPYVPSKREFKKHNKHVVTLRMTYGFFTLRAPSGLC